MRTDRLWAIECVVICDSAFWKRAAAVLACCGAIGSAAGCRGRAHDDLYQAKMAYEIRVLEDQLYDADYQNRVLRDELSRARYPSDQPAPQQPAPTRAQGTLGTNKPRSAPSVTPGGDTSGSSGYDLLELTDPAVPPAPEEAARSAAEPQPPSKTPLGTDPGAGRQPPSKTPLGTDPGAGRSTDSPPVGTAPVGTAQPPADSSEVQPLTDPPSAGLGMPSETAAPTDEADPKGAIFELPPPMKLPSPAELIPPGESEMMDEPIIPGPELPPDEDPGLPPGRILVPKDAKTMRFETGPQEPAAVPDHLELHDGLSGGHRLQPDGEVDGLYLVVTVKDQSGRILSLDDFDVDADLTVVVIDPDDDSADNRVGRWDFKPGEVREMIGQTPVDGIHIPIAWQDRIPSGDEVIVHIRMAAAEDEMRCQGNVRLQQSVAVSHWLPRG